MNAENRNEQINEMIQFQNDFEIIEKFTKDISEAICEDCKLVLKYQVESDCPFWARIENGDGQIVKEENSFDDDFCQTGKSFSSAIKLLAEQIKKDQH